MLTELREPGDTLTLDNQAVVWWSQTKPHQDCSNKDLREYLLEHTQQDIPGASGKLLRIRYP